MSRTPIHPGEILRDELEEIGLPAKRLADMIKVPPGRLYQVLKGVLRQNPMKWLINGFGRG
jgi:plasmid maintenance system antidote protein VapI